MCDGDIHFWRQSLVFAADSLHALSVGFILPFPSVVNPAILSPNATDIRATEDQASWINSLYGFSGVVGFCTVPSIMQHYGRKWTLMALNLFVVTGFIMIALAENVVTLYAARIIQGLSVCGIYLTSIILAEYVHPKRRGYFISLQKGSIALGSLICHALALVCNWRQIAAMASIANVLGIFLTLFWPESPAYLAMKGRYEECFKSYKYLNGDTQTSRKELDDLVSAQTERREREKREDAKTKKWSTIFGKWFRKDFLKPFFIVTLITIILISCGRYFNLVFIIQILTDITGNNSIAIYCSIGLDFLTVISCCTSSYVITKLSRRTMLFTFGYFSVALIFSISFVVYLQSNGIMPDVVWLSPSIILLNSFIINLGIIPVCLTVTGEMFPLEHRGTGSTASGIVFTLLYAISMKFTAVIIEKSGIHGTYGIYGLFLAISLLILHIILPETKDKTLQQIEDEIKSTIRPLVRQELETLARV